MGCAPQDENCAKLPLAGASKSEID